MDRALLIFSLFLVTISAHAELETDRIAGECAGFWAAKNYLPEEQRLAGMSNAISMADNQSRALKFAHAWLDKLKKYAGNKSMTDSMVFSAVGDCRKIGIR